MRILTSLLAVFAVIGTAALARPPLRDVAAIDDMVMQVAIADEIRKSCDGISARMLTAYMTLNGLKSQARDLGYSDAEIETYVTSKSEKSRMRAKAEAFLAANGVPAGDRTALCRFGQTQIQTQTQIGQLLR